MTPHQLSRRRTNSPLHCEQPGVVPKTHKTLMSYLFLSPSSRHPVFFHHITSRSLSKCFITDGGHRCAERDTSLIIWELVDRGEVQNLKPVSRVQAYSQLSKTCGKRGQLDGKQSSNGIHSSPSKRRWECDIIPCLGVDPLTSEGDVDLCRLKGTTSGPFFKSRGDRNLFRSDKEEVIYLNEPRGKNANTRRVEK